MIENYQQTVERLERERNDAREEIGRLEKWLRLIQEMTNNPRIQLACIQARDGREAPDVF